MRRSMNVCGGVVLAVIAVVIAAGQRAPAQTGQKPATIKIAGATFREGKAGEYEYEKGEMTLQGEEGSIAIAPGVLVISKGDKHLRLRAGEVIVQATTKEGHTAATGIAPGTISNHENGQIGLVVTSHNIELMQYDGKSPAVSVWVSPENLARFVMLDGSDPAFEVTVRPEGVKNAPENMGTPLGATLTLLAKGDKPVMARIMAYFGGKDHVMWGHRVVDGKLESVPQKP